MVRINEEDRWALKKNRDVHIYVIIFIYNVHHQVMNISIRNWDHSDGRSWSRSIKRKRQK